MHHASILIIFRLPPFESRLCNCYLYLPRDLRCSNMQIMSTSEGNASRFEGRPLGFRIHFRYNLSRATLLAVSRPPPGAFRAWHSGFCCREYRKAIRAAIRRLTPEKSFNASIIKFLQFGKKSYLLGWKLMFYSEHLF